MIALVGFLGTGLGRFAASAGIALMLLTGAYTKGHLDGASRVRAAVAAATIAEQSRQAAAIAAVTEAAQKLSDTDAAEITRLQAQVDQLAGEVNARPVDKQCQIGKADAQTLNRIR